MQGRLSALEGTPPTPYPYTQDVVFGGQQGAERAVAQQRGIGPGMPVGKAKEMENAGANAQTIFHTTGWYHAPDDQWKWVLSDKDAKLKPEAFLNYTTGDPNIPAEIRPKPSGRMLKSPASGKSTYLTDVLDHPDLYAVYPQLKDTKIGPMSQANKAIGATAEYNPETNVVAFNTDRPDKDITAALLHEIQHGIQTHENFAMGGGPQNFYPEGFTQWANPLTSNLSNAMRDLLNKNPDASPSYIRYVLDAHARGDELQPETEDTFKKLIDKISPDDLAKYTKAVEDYRPVQQVHDNAYKEYRRVAGEAEAFQAQKQFEDQDWTQLPTQMPDFPPGLEQHVRRNYGEPFVPGKSFPQVAPVQPKPSALDGSGSSGTRTLSGDLAAGSLEDEPVYVEGKGWETGDFSRAYPGRGSSVDAGDWGIAAKTPYDVDPGMDALNPQLKGSRAWFEDRDSAPFSSDIENPRLKKETRFTPVEHDPFNDSTDRDPSTLLYNFAPSDRDSFIEDVKQPKFTPVEHDPFQGIDPLAGTRVAPTLMSPQQSALSPMFGFDYSDYSDLGAAAQGNQAPQAQPTSYSSFAPPVNLVQPRNY